MDIRRPTDLKLRKVLVLSPEAIFDGTMGEVKPTNEKIEQLVKPLLNKGSHYLIAVEEDKIMGWILVGESKDQFTDNLYGFIYELFVIKAGKISKFWRLNKRQCPGIKTQEGFRGIVDFTRSVRTFGHPNHFPIRQYGEFG